MKKDENLRSARISKLIRLINGESNIDQVFNWNRPTNLGKSHITKYETSRKYFESLFLRAIENGASILQPGMKDFMSHLTDVRQQWAPLEGVRISRPRGFPVTRVTAGQHICLRTVTSNKQLL